MYNNKELTYFQNVRKELLELIPKSKRDGRVLEVGAGSGATLRFAKENHYAKEVYGIELCKLDGQNEEVFDGFIVGNIETMELLPYEKDFFDVILCGDVLEHLVDPYSVVLRLKKYLKEDGVLIASLPNIRHFSILKKIIFQGDFRYEESGILDKTHLRFFCKKNMIELFTDNGWKLQYIVSNSNLIGRTTKWINKFTFNIFDEFLAAQYYLILGKKC
ncbi:class I SAM-dependent methyltransferase [Sulfurimonas sp.]